MRTARWWQTGVIYQIYPRSFQDTTGDGVGDLRGVVQRLAYLVELGVDAIWISPIFISPMADCGYDIADHTDIDRLFGTLTDFDALLEAAHARGIKLILDLVPNHTSDQHAWFVDSRSARTSDKRDWYIWRDPAPGGGPPTNWLSSFGGSAWTHDEVTRQYYYHAFLSQQPDLNWRNPRVRAAIYHVMRFWLRRGVDGFRVDVIWHLIKDEVFRDNPPNPAFRPDEPPHHALVPLYTTDRPEVHDVISEMRRVVDEFADRVLIGEIYLPVERLISYYGRDRPLLRYSRSPQSNCPRTNYPIACSRARSKTRTRLRSPTNFVTATRFIRPEDMKESVLISHDLSRHAEWLREYIDLAFEELHTFIKWGLINGSL
jgi:alpha-glucosidase